MAFTETYDVVVYGDTWAAVFAARAAADQKGVRVCLVSPAQSLGGAIRQGLGVIDRGSHGSAGIGYLSEIFFDWLTRAGGQLTGTQYYISPSLMDRFMRDMVGGRPFSLRVIAGSSYYVTSVAKSGAAITSITLSDGSVITGTQFIDASEEGDLAALAGVTMVIGRDGTTDYNEVEAGFHPVPSTFKAIDAYSGGSLLYGVKPYPSMAAGHSDAGVQCYTFRCCVTRNPAERLPWPKPAGYDPDLFELQRRLNATNLANANWAPIREQPTIDGRIDINGEWGIPDQWDYPGANVTTRANIATKIYNQQFGWYWFLANDPSVNVSIRNYMNQFGPVRGEFMNSPYSSGVPYQVYRRTTRRMIGQYVMTRADTKRASDGGTPTKTHPIAMHYYSIDSHTVQILEYTSGGQPGIIYDGINNDLSLDRSVVPYQLPWEAILPNFSECSNLQVPVCASMSDVANASMRIDLHKANGASAAGCAAALCIKNAVALSGLSYATLSAALVAKGQVLSYP